MSLWNDNQKGGYLMSGDMLDGKPAIPWTPFWRTRRWAAHFLFRIGTFVANKIANPIDQLANNICVDPPREAVPPLDIVALLRVAAVLRKFEKVEFKPRPYVDPVTELLGPGYADACGQCSDWPYDRDGVQ